MGDRDRLVQLLERHVRGDGGDDTPRSQQSYDRICHLYTKQICAWIFTVFKVISKFAFLFVIPNDLIAG